MFSVIFEVHPKLDQWDAYLGNAKMLRPELELVDGFIDNIRYKSLTREGWILSLSGWRDEKSVVRWRTKMRHHMVQEKGRSEILLDYHLRVGQITQDTRVPEAHAVAEQRLDETEVGEGTTVTLIDAKRPAQGRKIEPGRLLRISWPQSLCGWDDRLGRVRRRAHARRSHPARVLAHQGRCGGFRKHAQPARRRAAAAGAGRARLRHVRPSRGAAILPGGHAPRASA
jgi:heme-degrading monooxygenase HmoA